MDLDLLGKTAVITGGSMGIGKAIAKQLAFEGMDIVIAARTLGTLELAADEISKETGAKVSYVIVDTGDDLSVREMVRKSLDLLGRVDVLVNCAAMPGGMSAPPELENITNDQFWSDMNIKVLGYLRCAKEVSPIMKQNGWGRIINISGLAARQSGNTVGSMRNVAVVAMTKNLADELGPFGINVTVVHPGATRTEKTPANLARQSKNLGITIDEVEQRMAESNSVKKIISADEIAYIVAFLASPKSVAINGDVIAAGGGTSRDIHY